MTIPNFLIMGSAKAGTSSLYYYLKQHPQIYMSPLKEPRFFAPELYTTYNNGVRSGGRKSALSFEEYCKLFKEVSSEIAIGEASTDYLYIPSTPARIKKLLPEVKLIAILRNPVERAFSAYCYQFRDGYETLSFEQALSEDPGRIRNGFRPIWHYKEVGFYSAQVRRYFEIFERKQIKIYLYEDLKNNETALIKDIYGFLGVNDNFIPDLTPKNVSGVPKSRYLYDIFTKKNLVKSFFKPLFTKQAREMIQDFVVTKTLKSKPIMKSEIRQDLIKIYQKDILKLQDLINRDLSGWIDIK